MAKLVCEIELKGETIVRGLTTVPSIVPVLVKTTPGVGQPFWYWDSIPAGKVVAADFTNAPIATDDADVNAGLMYAKVVDPLDVLVYDPPKVPVTPAVATKTTTTA